MNKFGCCLSQHFVRTYSIIGRVQCLSSKLINEFYFFHRYALNSKDKKEDGCKCLMFNMII